MLVDHFLRDAAQRFPDKAALVCGGERLTFAGLDRMSGRLAGSLQELGIRRGDRVVIHLENSAEAVLSIAATLKAAGVIVVLNPTMKSDKVTHIVNDCKARVLICEGRTPGLIDALTSQAPSLTAIVTVSTPAGIESDAGRGCRIVPLAALLTDPPASAVPAAVRIDQDLAAIVYTSGSTGVPKGVVLSHLNIVAAASSITSYLENDASDVILNVLPLSFDYGLYQILMAWKVGATLVLEKSFAYPPVILDVLAREHVTGFPIVPTIAALLVKHDLTQYDLSSLRYVSSTGAALPPAHIESLRRLLPRVRIYSMYGITEAKRVSYLDPSELDRRPTSVGKPMPNVEVFVADERGRLQQSGAGELVVRGSNVMQGYWGKPEETDAVLRPGLFPGERVLYTGDLFRIDDEGYLYFIGRKDDIIKSRGEKVSPREVENVLHEIAGVVEAVVMGVPDPILGNAVKACVTIDPTSGLSEQDVARYCAQRLEDVLIPRIIEIVPAMPRTSTGKIDRKELLARASA